MRGKIERVVDGKIVGWIQDEFAPNTRIEFELFVNFDSVGKGVANIMRGDLASKNIGDGAHCFRHTIPRGFKLKAGDIVSICAPGGRDFGILPLTITSENVAQFEKLNRPKKIIEPTPKPKSPSLPAAAILEQSPPKKESASLSPPKPVNRKISRKAPKDHPSLIFVEETLNSPFKSLFELIGNNEPKIAAIIEKAFKEEAWRLCVLMTRALPPSFEKSLRILVFEARAYLYLQQYESAIEVLEKIRSKFPDKHGPIFYLGICHARLSNWEAAVEVFRYCCSLEPVKEAKYYLELGRALVRIAYGAFGVVSENRAILPEAERALLTAANLEKKSPAPCRELAQFLLGNNRIEDAVHWAKQAILRNEKDLGAWIDLTRVCVRANRIEEALEAANKSVEIAPNDDTAKFNLRLISRLSEAKDNSKLIGLTIIKIGAHNINSQYSSETLEINKENEFVDSVAVSKNCWIAIDFGSGIDEKAHRELVDVGGFEWAGIVKNSANPNIVVLRRELVLSLIQAGIITRHTRVKSVLDIVMRCARTSDIANQKLDIESPSNYLQKTALLFSQYGIRKFGGGEHFLQQMAQIYKELGFNVLIVGTDPNFTGQEGEENGIRYKYIEKTTADFTRLVFDENAFVCHMISGLAFEVTSAARHFNTSIIHGIHFWRDVMVPPSPSNGYYPDVDLELPGGRPEFSGVIRDSEAIYANSQFTREVVEKLHGANLPIIYSLPDPIEIEPPQKKELDNRDFVLLVNSRVDKGFDIFVKTAALLPNIRFCAIASQSTGRSAKEIIDFYGAKNVEILDYVADLSELYKQARVVAVPSYKFVETFSRVVIEAHRFGVPVVGANRGNVNYLLLQSGGALPEDENIWAKEISRLFNDQEYWLERSKLALENSARYDFSMQKPRLSNLVKSLEKPLLIGVGSGLGNIIHTTPLIRNIARRFGRPVDVVMASDHNDMLFVTANKNYVSHVFNLSGDVFSRRYEAVFLTHSFGTAIPRFSTNKLILSRNWRNFHPGEDLHEAEFNLAAAQALLGIDYDNSDITGYFLGDYVYHKPDETFIGFHAGSKGGIWGAKRWPHYETLAKRLMAKGYKVASFGTPNEYVEGTIDRTGGTIEEMTKKMLECTHFVSNDSGVMNIANALGIRLIALFAPTNVDTRGPLCPNSSSISVDSICSPCELDRGPQSKFTNMQCRCIESIRVEEVMAELKL